MSRIIISNNICCLRSTCCGWRFESIFSNKNNHTGRDRPLSSLGAPGKPAVLGRGDIAVAVSDPVARLCGTGNVKIARMAENGDNEKMAALEAKICHQIEYYFGDFNLPRDKFLKEQIKLDEGWVPLEIMIKFNRLNRLTKDFNVIVEALNKSKAELMEISEDKTKIRRSPSKPLPEVTDEYKNDVKNRSVYIVSGPLMHLIIS